MGRDDVTLDDRDPVFLDRNRGGQMLASLSPADRVIFSTNLQYNVPSISPRFENLMD